MVGGTYGLTSMRLDRELGTSGRMTTHSCFCDMVGWVVMKVLVIAVRKTLAER